MSKNVDKYYYRQMDKTAGLEHRIHRTKIVATVGPACDTYEKLLELVKCGVNVFRLNFSHGGHDDKARIIGFIREINKNEPYNISILGDLQGPKLRVGEIENKKMKPVCTLPFKFSANLNQRLCNGQQILICYFADNRRGILVINRKLFNFYRLK